MLNLLASGSSCSESGVALGIVFAILIIVGIFVLYCYICLQIAVSKNLSASHKWLGLMGILGIIIMLFLKPKFVKCSNCGYEYHPAEETCPFCQHNMLKTSNRLIKESIDNKE